MIVFLILAMLICFGLLEYFSIRLSENAVRSHVEADLKLCAPDEEITLRYTLSNSSFLPLFYVGLSFDFDRGITVCPPNGNKERWDLREDFFGSHVDQKIHLMPHRRVSGQVRIKIKERGSYTIGQRFIETGDYLGIKASVRKEESDRNVICTVRSWEDELEFDPLGGILGDVSVMRFIHEDPCLLIGYRDYTGREPMKQISWYQTAKTGKLTVREQDHTADANVTVLLNLEGGNKPALERCLSLTRSVCEKLEEKGIPYSFRSNGDVWDVTEGVGTAHLFPILRSLGLSMLACYYTFDKVADRCISEGRADRTYIVISGETPKSALQKLQAHSEHPVISFNGKESDAV